jgi:hypothetical protein
MFYQEKSGSPASDAISLSIVCQYLIINAAAAICRRKFGKKIVRKYVLRALKWQKKTN